jgi:hypothetical protein
MRRMFLEATPFLGADWYSDSYVQRFMNAANESIARAVGGINICQVSATLCWSSQTNCTRYRLERFCHYYNLFRI